MLATLIIAIALLGTALSAEAQDLVGDVHVPSNAGPVSENATDLFVGDLGAEIGIGCSRGPNDFAVGPFSLSGPLGWHVTRLYYYVFTNLYTDSDLSFKVWPASSDLPGAEVGSQSGLNATAGPQTVSIQPAIEVPESAFFFGLTQPSTIQWLRIGLDTSSESTMESFIRAPACEVANWATLTSIGFPGNWVMMVTVQDDDTVPVELRTWGEVKARFRNL